jgi:transcription antitermination factor NusB
MMLAQADLRGREVLDEFKRLLVLAPDEEPEDEDEDERVMEKLRKSFANEDVRRFALDLVDGTLDAQEEIDAIITDAAQNWQLRRMAIVDRNVLRMAIYEMLHAADIPAKVSINEAIELGKRYSTQQSGSFINGILDRIRRERQL